MLTQVLPRTEIDRANFGTFHPPPTGRSAAGPLKVESRTAGARVTRSQATGSICTHPRQSLVVTIPNPDRGCGTGRLELDRSKRRVPLGPWASDCSLHWCKGSIVLGERSLNSLVLPYLNPFRRRKRTSFRLAFFGVMLKKTAAQGDRYSRGISDFCAPRAK